MIICTGSMYMSNTSAQTAYIKVCSESTLNVSADFTRTVKVMASFRM